MCPIFKIDEFVIDKEANYFIDTCVFVDIYASYIFDTPEKEIRSMSNFYSKLISNKCKIVICSLILSEFINLSLRKHYEFYKSSLSISYKKFRDSIDCEPIIRDIQQDINKILKHTIKIGDNFNNIDIKCLLDRLNICDFNDSYYIELCKNSNYYLVTRDRDILKNGDINIITSLKI